MVEYIEREAVCNDCANRAICVDKSKCTVGRAHAADVVEVVHGRWIYKRTYYDADECNCSECGQVMTSFKGVRMNFCPHCGAKMDGG